MTLPFKDALQRARDASGLSLRKLADKAGVSYEQLKKINQGKTLSTNAEDALKLAQAVGVSFEDFLEGNVSATPPTVAIAGKVGAGARVPVFDVYEKGDGPQVECPPGLSPHGIVAVEVEGDSMEPVYSEGDILFYSRNGHEGVPSDVLGYKCVCEDENGMGWVKQVRQGSEPGLYHLISLNPTAHNELNVHLKWAARVRLHWPAELAKK
ncbi:XRE family transcriptional regulator [Epibacterium ulvae]|uniref:XRE family transcriptional regulator n=1 Tax=Epibacterium ulvae TaxID=1156985 RepID=UPI0024907083|nr:S24 family peptidase [Epibacterium ulvae]